MLTTTFLVIVVVIFGCFSSFIINVINFDEVGADFSPLVLSVNDGLIIGNEAKHLMWFMQISDIHLSVHFDPGRKTDLETFCNSVVDTVKPSVVIASGDLTDSRTPTPFGSDQIEQEWIWYHEVLNSTRIREKTIWLDIRGNHDNFNVYSWNSSNNYFKKYSEIGPTNQRHYIYMLTQGNDIYKFVAIDATLVPSPKRPFNFIGHLREEDMKHIKTMVEESPSSNSTVWFGHYPTSSIYDESYHLRDIINGPYLCGHFHTMGGLVRHMYATQRTGYLEIEVADWKESRMFRVAAFDHGLFSFIDVKLNQWPIILITNPKPALFATPKFEPYHRIYQSTHIRALIFSPQQLIRVLYQIDNGPWISMTSSPSIPALYVHPWEPEKYRAGLHKISVKAMDDRENEQIVSHDFSLDGTRPDFSFGSRLVLRTSTRTFLQTLFISMVFLSIFPLIIMRILFLYNKGKVIRVRAKLSPMYKFHRKLYMISCLDKYFYCLILIPLYSIVGPWFVGNVLDDHWGIYFAWGGFIDGQFVPMGLTYLFGVINLLLFHLPFLFCIAHAVDYQCSTISNNRRENIITGKLLKPRNFVFAFIVLCHILINQGFWINFGLKSVIFGFERFWSLIIYLYLYLSTFCLTPASYNENLKDKEQTN